MKRKQALSFDLYWSFRSPYSYLIAPRLLALTRDYKVVCTFRPVYPLAVRVENFFETVNPLWPGYLMHDLPREAERLGMPLHWPDPDPIVQDFTTMKVADEQPYIRHLTRLGVAAEREGKGLAFATTVSARLWGGKKNWNKGDALSAATAKADLALPALEEVLRTQPDELDAQISKNEANQRAAGHWGVPLMVFEGEPFFGQDRVDSLIWRMKKQGLRARQ